ncbi:unnamed protein product [Heterobilharzia americana]|nr:unnamed protein product [Heterobilharzia americana]
MDAPITSDEVRLIFSQIDKNHNGHDAKFDRREIKEFVSRLDGDGDGQISLQELTRGLTGRY